MKQKEYLKALCKAGSLPYPYNDSKLAENACALHNLGIAEIKSGVVLLKSASKAKQFLNR